MAFDQGIDFRSTAIFVTDPSGCTSEIGTTANYPRSTPQGNTVGWEDAPSGATRNRSAAVDARLAGIAFSANGTPKRYRIDLPSSGWYRITLAVGDQSSSQNQSVDVLDGTTVLSHVVGGTAQTIGSDANAFYDACGVEYSSANWPTQAVSFVAFFSTTICRIRIANVGSGSSSIAHVRVSDAVAAVPSFNGGFDFRATSAFVTDPTNCSPIPGAVANYPHITQQGFTCGWEDVPTGVNNRSSGVDARLAGEAVSLNTAAVKRFRIDLPAAGTWRIGLALGDATTAQVQYGELFDDTSSLGVVVSNGSSGSAQFYDATGTLRTSVADWVANQAEVSKTLSTTTLRLALGRGTAGGSNSSTLAHIHVSQAITIAGTSSLAAIITRFVRFVASIAGTSSLSAAVGHAKAVAANIAGTSSLSATISGLHRQITAAISGTSSLSATVATGGPKVFTATIHGTSSLKTAFPYQTSSATILVKGDDANSTTYLALGSAQIFLNADAPTLPSGYQPTSGVIKLAAGSATQPTLTQPSAGVIVVRGDAPILFTMYRPVSGVISLRADSPTVIPYSTSAGVIKVTGDPPGGVPTAMVSARIILVGGPPNVFPLQVSSSGVILLKGDPPTIAHVGYIMNESGIIRLRSDVPVVTPLTEPPPPPPPPPPGTGLAVSGTE